MATEGGESPAVDAPRASDGPDPSDAPRPTDVSEQSDDVVVTTVVSADDPRSTVPPPDAEERPEPAADEVDDLAWGWAEVDDDVHVRFAVAPPPPAAPPAAPFATPARADAAPPSAPQGPTKQLSAIEERLAAIEGADAPHLSAIEERLVALEAVPTTVDNLGKAIRHELERCAGVLFGHDRALGTLASRLEAVEAAGKAADDPTAALAERARFAEEAVARVLDHVDRMDHRLVAMETRVEPLEPLPTVVQALRRAVRASDDLIAGETSAREQALVALAGQQATEAQARDDALRRLVAQDLDRVSGVSAAQAKGLADVAERLAAAENRLAPLDSAPDDIAALSRILRRELDAIVTDNQARDQMLRRALQNEIEQLRATSEAREVLAQGLATRLDLLESRAAEAAQVSETALGAAGGRLDALESRMATVDGARADLDALGDNVRRELEALRGAGQAHDQLAGELTRRVSAVDARLARLDPVPGEVQSLRTAMLQEAERTVTSLRAADERIGQLSWVPGEFQEARKRIMALTSGVQASQDRVRQLEAALISINERLEGLRARLSAAAPPGSPG